MACQRFPLAAPPRRGDNVGPTTFCALMATNYISTYLGNKFYPQEGKIERVDIVDIAHGLAYQCRFNGQTRDFYSVAQHSVLVADLVAPEIQLEALLHDAAEAYLGDMVKPLKVLLPDFSEVEDKVMKAIAKTFRLNYRHYAPIKRADLIVLATEKRDLMPHSVESWTYLHGIDPLNMVIEPLSPADAKAQFLARFEALYDPRSDKPQMQLNW